MTRPERIAALVCVLCALVAMLLSACATKTEPLPHYPCKDAQGRVYQCDVWEWLEQQPKSRESTTAQTGERHG